MNIRIGKIRLRPTRTEAGLLLVGGAGLVVAGVRGSAWAAVLGAAAMAGAGLSLWEQARELRDPELMNGIFWTGGKASATDGDAGAAAVAGILDDGGRP